MAHHHHGSPAPRRRIAIGRALLLVAVLAPVGCGSDDSGTDGVTAPRVAAPATLLPDGTVPWVDERAAESEVQLPDPNRGRPSPDDAAAVDACTAGDLTGELERWTRKLHRDDFGKVIGDNGLLGFVRVRNAGAAACRLRGEVPAQLLVGGRALDISTSHSVNEEAQRRAILLAPGERGELRLDWSSPYCGRPRAGRQQLELELPDGGGRLRVPVRRATFPRCFSEETAPGRSSVLSSGVFAYASVATPLDSPLNGLRVRVEAGSPVPAGRMLTYHVVLSNPTKTAISLRPCPAYQQSRFSSATPAGAEAVNDAALYRLNCRPLRSIAAGGRRRFEMRVRVPPALAKGRRLSVAWGLRARRVAGSPALEGGFEVTTPSRPSG